MMNAQGSVQEVSSKPDRGQTNGASAPRPTEEAGAAESPTKARPSRPLLRALGVEREINAARVEDATLGELLTQSLFGEDDSDPMDGILRSLGDDLSMIRSALQTEEVLPGDPDVQNSMYRLQRRVEVAHRLWRRLVKATDYGASDPSAAPAAAAEPASTPAPAAQGPEPYTLFKAGAMLGRAGVALAAFADLAERCAASAVPRREAYDAGVEARRLLKEAYEIAQLDEERVTGLTRSRIDGLLRCLLGSAEAVDVAVEQLAKTRFRRRERSARVHDAIQRAQGQLRIAHRYANEVIDVLQHEVLPKPWGMLEEWPQIHAEACRIAPDVPRHLIDGAAGQSVPLMHVTPQLVANFARAIADAQDRAAKTEQKP
ncbi:hypothetical protein WMF30_40300 [Sorangium sp. So ce134]